MRNRKSCEAKDWVSDFRAAALLWGLPGVMIFLAVFLSPFTKTGIWSGALLWMGAACVLNAARCGRTHCHVTGPYFFLLAMGTVLHGFRIVDLGANDWMWLGLALMAGGGVLWFVTERVWGTFLPAKR
ncbi:MAG: hypothetical protein WD032_03905 [Nitrospirales bacterium]